MRVSPNQRPTSWPGLLAIILLGLLIAFFLLVNLPQRSTAQIYSNWAEVNGAPVFNWDTLTFGNLPELGADGYFEMPSEVVGELGYDPTRHWWSGQSPAETFQLGDLQDYFQPYLFSQEQIAEITNLDLSAIALSEFPLMAKQNLGRLMQRVPGLADQQFGAIDPIKELVLKYKPHLFDRWEWDQKWVRDRQWIAPIEEWVWNQDLGHSVLRLIKPGYWQELDSGHWEQLDTGKWAYDPELQAYWEGQSLGAIAGELEFGLLSLKDLDLSKYNLSSIPGLEATALEEFNDWEKTTLAEVPGLADVPFSQFPKPPQRTGFGFVALHDVTYGPKEHRRYRTVTGSNEVGFEYACDVQYGAPDGCAYVELSAPSSLGLAGDRYLHGRQWIQGGRDPGSQMVPGGEGVLGQVNGGKEPTGRLPFGPVFKVVLTGTDESKGEAQFSLYFRYCQRGIVDLGCTPYMLGPVPWLTHHEKDLIFIGLTPGIAPDNAPEMGEIPAELQDQIDQITGGGGDTSLGEIDGDCLKKVVQAAPASNRAAAVSLAPHILAEAKSAGLTPGQTAYVLATVQAETNFRSRSEDGANCGRYGPGCYYGRGPTQLTHEYNYRYWGNRLGIDLINNPDLANDPKIGAKIAVLGARDGTFTGMTRQGTLIAGGGHKLSDYINGSKQDFVGARKIVNDGDKKHAIAASARRYQQALEGCSTGTGTAGGSGKVTGNFKSPLNPGVPVTSDFGPRSAPTAGASSNHKGIDLGVGNGTPVKASDGGTVIYSGTARGYGKVMIIDHGNGVTTRYAHLQAFMARTGQKVGQGQVVARADSTGVGTGAHLHFEIRVNSNPSQPFSGKAIDPETRINF